jgi:hypothetical protein
MNMGSHSAGHNLRRAAIAMFGTLLGLASAAWLTAPTHPHG